MPNAVFSFGTLQSALVQEALFGRAVPTAPDALAGWRVVAITISDPDVIATSGTDQHPALVETASAEDLVIGSVLELTAAELDAADSYERVAYRRTDVVLESGRRAWVYILRDGPYG